MVSKRIIGIDPEPRVETGTVQFGDDWPGLFIRGDVCFTFAAALEEVLEAMPRRPNLSCRVLTDLLEMLRATNVGSKKCAS
jgi:hypothetical protein